MLQSRNPEKKLCAYFRGFGTGYDVVKYCRSNVFALAYTVTVQFSVTFHFLPLYPIISAVFSILPNNPEYWKSEHEIR